MRVAFRVDASAQIGSGHLARCLTLASKLCQNGASTRFICRQLPASWVEKIRGSGHEIELLRPAPDTYDRSDLHHAEWLAVSQKTDAEQMLAALGDRSWDWVVVDHYALDSRWEAMIRSGANKIMVIDDIADRRHHCDILLDQNLYPDMATRYEWLVPASCRQLIGPRYALLRNEFGRLRKTTGIRSGDVERLLVFFGGADLDNHTLKTVDVLESLPDRAFEVDVVIGNLSPHLERIETACRESGFACHIQSERIAELMSAADLGIGAAGAASWERCCLGLPNITVALAENQKNIAASLAEIGACRLLDPGALFQNKLQVCLTELLSNKHEIKSMSQIAFDVLDGSGVDAVTNEMAVHS